MKKAQKKKKANICQQALAVPTNSRTKAKPATKFSKDGYLALRMMLGLLDLQVSCGGTCYRNSLTTLSTFFFPFPWIFSIFILFYFILFYIILFCFVLFFYFLFVLFFYYLFFFVFFFSFSILDTSF